MGGIAGIAFSLIIIFSLALNLPAQSSYVELASPLSSQAPQNPVDGTSVEPVQNIVFREQVSSELPIRLKVPKINVDAVLEHVGLTADRAMDVPKDPAYVAWFELGPRPGEKGSAVISGHSGWRNGIPAVFDNLHKLQKGDKVYVENGKGVITSFVVRELRTYGENEDASDVFGSSDGKAHLNLITCEGVWDKVSKSYSKRLVSIYR